MNTKKRMIQMIIHRGTALLGAGYSATAFHSVLLKLRHRIHAVIQPIATSQTSGRTSAHTYNTVLRRLEVAYGKTPNSLNRNFMSGQPPPYDHARLHLKLNQDANLGSRTTKASCTILKKSSPATPTTSAR